MSTEFDSGFVVIEIYVSRDRERKILSLCFGYRFNAENSSKFRSDFSLHSITNLFRRLLNAWVPMCLISMGSDDIEFLLVNPLRNISIFIIQTTMPRGSSRSRSGSPFRRGPTRSSTYSQAPPRMSPPPRTAPPPHTGTSPLGGMGSMLAAGLALGTGSEIAH